MKTAIVTTQHAINYGAVLQAYALSTFLREELHVENEILSYWPPYYKDSRTIFQRTEDLRTLLRNAYVLIHPQIIKALQRRIDNVCAFVDEYLPRSEINYYSGEELVSSPPDVDCYICGSDQIWNLALRYYDPVFFLDFTRDMTGVKKIAYAPSITDPVPEAKVSLLKRYLENIDYISVRENSDVSIIQKLTNRKVSHVMDPVFLLSAARWTEIASEPEIKEPYILCYFLSCSDLAVEAVKKLKKITGYPVVYINLMARDRLNADVCIRDADPRQFVGYIKNASFICTNSYHGTVFSTIFKKNYCTIPKHTGNSRIESLEETLRLGKRMFSADRVANLSTADLIVDYCLFDSAYQEFKNRSVNYLRDALGV